MNKILVTLLSFTMTGNFALAKGQHCKQNSDVKLECFVYTYSKIGKQVRFQSTRAEMEDLNAEQPDSSTCAARLSLTVSDGRLVTAQMGEDLKLVVYEPTGYGYVYLTEQQMARGKTAVILNQPLNNGWSYTMTCELNYP